MEHTGKLLEAKNMCTPIYQYKNGIFTYTRQGTQARISDIKITGRRTCYQSGQLWIAAKVVYSDGAQASAKITTTKVVDA